ncbi:unnamed protein product, partial [Musa acuminata subsp. burmannicoides]
MQRRHESCGERPSEALLLRVASITAVVVDDVVAAAFGRVRPCADAGLAVGVATSDQLVGAPALRRDRLRARATVAARPWLLSPYLLSDSWLGRKISGSSRAAERLTRNTKARTATTRPALLIFHTKNLVASNGGLEMKLG